MLTLFRLLIFGLLIYWVAKLLISFFSAGKPPIEVGGKSQKKPLDLSGKDIEDVEFKETKE